MRLRSKRRLLRGAVVAGKRKRDTGNRRIPAIDHRILRDHLAFAEVLAERLAVNRVARGSEEIQRESVWPRLIRIGLLSGGGFDDQERLDVCGGVEISPLNFHGDLS